MAGIRCKCGNALRNTVAPCPTQGLLLGDEDLEVRGARVERSLSEFLGAVAQGRLERWRQ